MFLNKNGFVSLIYIPFSDEYGTGIGYLIMLGSDFSDRIICFKLVRADFSDLNIADVKEPGDYDFCDFLLVKLYLIWKTGAALNKKAVEKVIQKNLRSSEMVDIRKKFESITGNKIIKRKDNSYEMRCVKNKS